MKRIKKIVAAASACVMCLSFSQLNPTVNAASNTYLRGDINEDGVVNLTDSLTLSLFLRGEKSATNSKLKQRLDVNQDRVIDKSDDEYICNIIRHATPSYIDTYSTGNDFTAPKTLLYHVYDSKSNSLVSKYMLSPESKIQTMGYSMPSNTVATAPNSGNTEKIQGNDDRYAENGLRGVVKTSTGGTAFVIDDHTLLTAAHCVTDCTKHTTANGGWEYNVSKKMNLEFFAASNKSFFKVDVDKIHIPEQYLETGSEQYDYALLTVKIDLSEYVDFNLGLANNNVMQSDTNSHAFVTGFGGGGTNVNPNLVGVRSTGSGMIRQVNDRNLYYDVDTSPGNSGSPVYVVNGNTKTVIAIHTGGFFNSRNWGTRITPDILHFVYNNPNL